jgi:hypothetical protein
MSRVRDEAEARYPALTQFFGCYLHEDWPIFSGTPEKAVDDAIASYPVEIRKQVRRELADLLQRTPDDTQLRKVLNVGLGVNLHFKRTAKARAFALEVHEKLLQSIKSHFERSA